MRSSILTNALSPKNTSHLDLKKAGLFVKDELLEEKLQNADKSITSVDLRENLLGTLNCHHLIRALKNKSKNIIALDLSANLLSLLDHYLPMTLRAIGTDVKILRLAQNKLNEMAFEALLESLQAASADNRELDLSENNFNENYYSLAQLKKIISTVHAKTVDFRGNKLGDTLDMTDRREIIYTLKKTGINFLLDEPLASEIRVSKGAYFLDYKKHENITLPVLFKPAKKIFTTDTMIAPPRPVPLITDKAKTALPTPTDGDAIRLLKM